MSIVPWIHNFPIATFVPDFPHTGLIQNNHTYKYSCSKNAVTLNLISVNKSTQVSKMSTSVPSRRRPRRKSVAHAKPEITGSLWLPWYWGSRHRFLLSFALCEKQIQNDNWFVDRRTNNMSRSGVARPQHGHTWSSKYTCRVKAGKTSTHNDAFHKWIGVWQGGCWV